MKQGVEISNITIHRKQRKKLPRQIQGKLTAMFVVAFTILSLASLTACGEVTEKELFTPEHMAYQKMSFDYTQTQVGDISPILNLDLKVEDFSRVNYSVKKQELLIDHVYIKVGDKVNKGDVLVSFKSDEIEKQIEGYKDTIEQNNMMVDHYKRLMEIDKNQDYTFDIKSIQDDTEIVALYLEEAKARLESYSITAEQSGTITYISDYLDQGFVVTDVTLITEACGSGKYTVSTRDTYEFHVGDTYSANSGIVSYDLMISDIQISEDAVGNTVQTIQFEPISDMSAVSEQDVLTITIEKPTIKNVVYVEKTYVYENDNKQKFVYVLDDEGYRDVVFVTVGDIVDEYIVITSGLNGGEKVTSN